MEIADLEIALIYNIVSFETYAQTYITYARVIISIYRAFMRAYLAKCFSTIWESKTGQKVELWVKLNIICFFIAVICQAQTGITESSNKKEITIKRE